MSYQVFARKYRPKSFKDVLGQDHVIQTLRNGIEQNRLAHAYLFVGPRGTGKTSTARIFAKALNCPNGPSIDFDPDDELCQEIAEGRSLDVIEIDGASNNGVDEVRDLRDNVRFAPTRCRFKIYYIDEVHMLSTAAFNALLKTLEEPPEHVKFIFATTEPNKILPTIISRCQRFDLRPIPTQTIADQLTFIANNEGITLDPAAAWAVAKGADGGMRDAQSMLDQLVSFCGNHVKEADVLDVFGFTSREIVSQLCQNIFSKNTPATLDLLNQQAASGKNLTQLLEDTIGCLRAILIAKVDPNADSDGIPINLWEALLTSADKVQTERILCLIDHFADAEARMKWANNKKLHLEIAIIKAIQSLNEVSISDVIAALAGAGTIQTTEVPAASTPQVEAQPTTPSPAAAAEPVENHVSEAPAEATLLEEPVTIVLDDSTEINEPPALPLEQQNTPEIDQNPPKKLTFASALANFDDLIDAAPEEAPEPSPSISQATQAAQTQKDDEKPVPVEQAPSPIDDFYQDPLIQKAIEIFDAQIQS